MIKKYLSSAKIVFKLFFMMGFESVKASLKSKEENKKPNYYPYQDTFNYKDIKIGNMVRLTTQAKKKYEANKHMGCCMGDEDLCTCKKMFENNNLTGLVVGLDLPVINVLWSNNMQTSILLDHIEELVL